MYAQKFSLYFFFCKSGEPEAKPDIKPGKQNNHKEFVGCSTHFLNINLVGEPRAGNTNGFSLDSMICVETQSSVCEQGGEG